jgi:hypothetical protein
VNIEFGLVGKNVETRLFRCPLVPPAAFWDVQHGPRGIALREDRLLFTKLCDLPGESCRIEEHLEIESRLVRGFCLGVNLGRSPDRLQHRGSDAASYHNVEAGSDPVGRITSGCAKNPGAKNCSYCGEMCSPTDGSHEAVSTCGTKALLPACSREGRSD